jgi:hypothetical protein
MLPPQRNNVGGEGYAKCLDLIVTQQLHVSKHDITLFSIHMCNYYQSIRNDINFKN